MLSILFLKHTRFYQLLVTLLVLLLITANFAM